MLLDPRFTTSYLGRKFSMETIATVVYIELEGGFWGLTTVDGDQLLPLNMPEQLKVEGAEVRVWVKPVEDAVTIQMWGTPVKITRFETTFS